jgi:hypothetical protein
VDKNAELIEAMQTALGRLQRQYNDLTLEFWALRLAWEAVRLAWYVVAQHEDGGKLDLVEIAVKDFKERYAAAEQQPEETPEWAQNHSPTAASACIGGRLKAVEEP